MNFPCPSLASMSPDFEKGKGFLGLGGKICTSSNTVCITMEEIGILPSGT
jgi:hypothetical protein